MTGAGPAPGWTRLAHAVAEQVPPADVDGVWLFSPLRHEGREWGTAVLSRVDGDRRRIYTARYALVVRGKERGKFGEHGGGKNHAGKTPATESGFPCNKFPAPAR